MTTNNYAHTAALRSEKLSFTILFMPSARELEEAKIRAEQTIRKTWRDIARLCTLGWGGPIESVEQDFPFVGEAVLSIGHQVSTNLPVLFFQSRESPPKDMIVAIPFWRDTGNPYNCRLAATGRNLRQNEVCLFNDFSQAFWFAIAMKMLPNPSDAHQFEEAIINWTGRELLQI